MAKNQTLKGRVNHMNIVLTNTLTGTKQTFIPRIPGQVSMYVCGITPYDDSHVGHARVYVSFDVLYRLLRYCGYHVTYCRNFTDVDDKIIRKSEQEFGNQAHAADIAQRYIKNYHADMLKLNCTAPAYEPCVTQHIPEIITFIQGLIDKDVAYEIDGDVYFAIQQFPAYGALSKHKLEDLRAGARVQVNEKKRDPLDFALWKHEPDGLSWPSPWGPGRPGWHIECSALAEKYLGMNIDIHAGGLDLVFPHHENEKAQSEALHNVPLVNYWLHNGFVRINEEKMSKSLGNFFTLRDVFKHSHPMVVRYYILTHHYRAPLEFSFEGLQSAEKSYRKLCRLFANVTADTNITYESQKDVAPVQDMLKFLCDDLNTPGMFGVLYGELNSLHQVTGATNNGVNSAGHDSLSSTLPDSLQARAIKGFLIEVLGLTLEQLPETETAVTAEMTQLLADREHARANKDWTRADIIRDQLNALGYQVQDKKKQ